ncbi:hypothetical protein [Nonomuraea sp. NPDC050310]|uniref:hypothetical protein n=1 Tax=Nonomuraea sp. NPDC050310 TaxID=3154935 RepID=UPI0033D46DF4
MPEAFLPQFEADLTLTLARPRAGEYQVIVGAVLGATPYRVRTNLVGEGGSGSLTVTPERVKVTPGVPVALTATWQGLTQGRHTAYVEYPNGTGTVLTIN